MNEYERKYGYYHDTTDMTRIQHDINRLEQELRGVEVTKEDGLYISAQQIREMQASLAELRRQYSRIIQTPIARPVFVRQTPQLSAEQRRIRDEAVARLRVRQEEQLRLRREERRRQVTPSSRNSI